MHVDIAPLTATVADRGGTREVPDPGLVAKIPFRQRPHGTDVHNVRRVGIVEYLAGVEPELGPVPAIEDAELAGPGDLVGETHAPGTEDTALLVQHHMGAKRHGLLLLDLVLSEPRVVEPEVHVEVL